MKTKRVLFLTLPMCAVAAAAIAFFVLIWDAGHFSASEFARLEEGMTQDEVSAILGARPGDYTNGAGTYRLLSNEGVVIENLSVANNQERLERCWCGLDGAIEVYFDENGRLTNKWHYEPWPPPPPVWRRIVARLSFEKKK
jgi:hypothetical protein